MESEDPPPKDQFSVSTASLFPDFDGLLKAVGEAASINRLQGVLVNMSAGPIATYLSVSWINRIGGPVLLTSLPEAWRREYLEQGYHQTDPAVYRARQTNGPFLWSSLNWRDKGAQALRKRMLNQLVPFQGISSGWHGPKGAFCLVTVNRHSGLMQESILSGANGARITALSAVLACRLVTLAEQPRSAQAPPTPREREILGLLVQGLSQSDAAEALGISKDTVFDHVNSLRTKFGARNVAQLVAIAIREGFLLP